MSGPCSYDEALDRLLGVTAPQPTLRLPLAQAGGLFLAESVVARVPLPRWRSASMDGFAVHGDDIAGATPEQPVPLTLVGATAAGGATPPRIPRGTAWRVATGGPIPPGIDSVIRQEDVTEDGAILAVRGTRDVGRNVREEGADVAVGTAVLQAGQELSAGRLALLASLAEFHPVVHRRPRVGVLTSGDEVVGPDAEDAILDGSGIGDANQPMLASLIHAAGGVTVPLGRVRDDPAAMVDAIQAAGDIDLLLTAGGVSVGPHDHVPSVMAALGAEAVVHRVRIRPGGPTRVAVLPGGVPWLGLPGNPVSAFVVFLLLGRPAIRRLLGDPAAAPAFHAAVLAEPVARHPTLDQFIRVTLSGDAIPQATPTGGQASWVLTSIAAADGVVRIPAGEGIVAPGSDVALLRP